MKLLRALRCDFNKTVVNIGFAGAVLLTAILCFTAVVYYDDSSDKSYSAFEALFSAQQGLIEYEPSFASVRVIRAGMSGYITMFLPIIVSFPFMVSFCAERNSGLIRMAIARTGELRYCISKFIASFVSGGLAAMIGFIIFSMVALLLFPDIESYGLTGEEISLILPRGVNGTILLSIAAAFVYGAVTTLPAFFLSSFCRDPYIITCVPFLLVYIWRTLIEKIGFNAVEKGDYDMLDRCYAFYPEAVNEIIMSADRPEMRLTLWFNIGLLVFTAGGAAIIFRSRQDKGR